MSEILGRVPVASGLSLCALRAAGRLRAPAPEVVAMHGVRTADLPDGGLGPASDAAATDGMVLGRLPRDHSYPRKKIKGVGSLFLSVLHKTKTPDPFFSDPYGSE